MLRAAVAFLVLLCLALLLGAVGLAGVSLEIARVVMIAFVVLALVGVGIGMIRGDHGRSGDVV